MLSTYQLLVRISVAIGFFYCTLALSLHSPELASAATITNTYTSNADTDPLPQWLKALNLTTIQVHQVLMIDAALNQQMLAILTTDQYERLQIFMSNDETDQADINDADLDLSLYQQAALDAVFEEAITNLVNILSQEQQQLFFYNLENRVPVRPVIRHNQHEF